MIGSEKLFLGTSEDNVQSHLTSGEFHVSVNVGYFQNTTDAIVAGKGFEPYPKEDVRVNFIPRVAHFVLIIIICAVLYIFL
jgi:hypothetical protein